MKQPLIAVQICVKTQDDVSEGPYLLHKSNVFLTLMWDKPAIGPN